MEAFSRTFLSLAVEAGVTTPTITRQLPILRRCVDPDDSAVLVARCVRPTRPLQGDYLLVMTYRRLLVTQESRLLHRLRLHLNSELRHLSNTTWNADPGTSAVELAVTAVDGVRERFCMNVGHPNRVWHLDALLSYLLRPRGSNQPSRSRPARSPGLRPAVAR